MSWKCCLAFAHRSRVSTYIEEMEMERAADLTILPGSCNKHLVEATYCKIDEKCLWQE